VSTEEQARNGYGLDAQRQTIEEHAARKGWTAEWK
jgi:DNA invertase Pin-like site-specific DNA recombinase